MSNEPKCTTPPAGWTCSREPGHSGPCAASPAVPAPKSEWDVATNPVLRYADSYRDMARQGAEQVSVWAVIADLERNIAPLFVMSLEPVGWMAAGELFIERDRAIDRAGKTPVIGLVDAGAVSRLRQFETAYKEWMDKTDWMDPAHPRELGMHRADAIKQRFDALRADNEALACNLRGKHALTGATYEHLVKERDCLRLRLDLVHLARESAKIEIDGLKALNDGLRDQLADVSSKLEMMAANSDDGDVVEICREALRGLSDSTGTKS